MQFLIEDIIVCILIRTELLQFVIKPELCRYLDICVIVRLAASDTSKLKFIFYTTNQVCSIVYTFCGGWGVAPLQHQAGYKGNDPKEVI